MDTFERCILSALAAVGIATALWFIAFMAIVELAK